MTTNYSWPASPYKGLSYYGPTDVPLFAGRDDDAQRCAKLLGLTSTRIMILHGATGCGKSSFLRAGLIPFLEKVGFQFLREGGEGQVKALFIRSTDNPLAKLAEALFDFASQKYEIETHSGAEIIDLSPALLGSTDRADFLEKVGTNAEAAAKVLNEIAKVWPKTLVLVIDQAEEVLTVNNQEEGKKYRKQFFDFMSRFSKRRFDLKLLIALRTEFYGRFIDHARQVAVDLVNNRDYLLSDLTEDQLVSAIERPTLKTPVATYGVPYEHYGFEYEPPDADGDGAEDGWGVARTIAKDLKRKDLAGGELPVLQIVCGNLYRITKQKAEECNATRWVISKHDYRELGGIEGQIDSHVGRVLEEMCHQYGIQDLDVFKEIDRWKEVLSKLVKTQVDGTVTTELGSAVELGKAARSVGCRVPFDKGVEYLSEEEMRILRPVTAIDAETKKTIPCYSLGHDVIGLVLKKWQASRETPNLKTARDAEERLRFWNARAKAAFFPETNEKRRTLWSRFRSLLAQPIPITESISLWRFAPAPTRRILRRNLLGFLARLWAVALIVTIPSVVSYVWYKRQERSDAKQLKIVKADVPTQFNRVKNSDEQRPVISLAKALVGTNEYSATFGDATGVMLNGLKPIEYKGPSASQSASQNDDKHYLSDIYADFAVSLHKAGRTKDAYAFWDKALEEVGRLNEKSDDSTLVKYTQDYLVRNISLSLIQVREFDKALEFFNKAPDTSWKNHYYKLDLAKALYQANQKLEANRLWNETLNNAKGENYATLGIALSMVQAGETDRAWELVEKSRPPVSMQAYEDLDVSNLSALDSLAEGFAQAREFDKAAKTAKMFEAKKGDKTPVLLAAKAVALAAIARYEAEAGQKEASDKHWGEVTDTRTALKSSVQEKAKSGSSPGDFRDSYTDIRNRSFLRNACVKVALQLAASGNLTGVDETLDPAIIGDDLIPDSYSRSLFTTDNFYKLVRRIGELGDDGRAYALVKRIKSNTAVRSSALVELSKGLTAGGRQEKARDLATNSDIDAQTRFLILAAVAQTLNAKRAPVERVKEVWEEASQAAQVLGYKEQSSANAVIGQGLACLHLYYDALKKLESPPATSSDKLEVYAAIISDDERRKHPDSNQSAADDCVEDWKMAWEKTPGN